MTARLRFAGILCCLTAVLLASRFARAAELRRTNRATTVHRQVNPIQPAQWIEVAPNEPIAELPPGAHFDGQVPCTSCGDHGGAPCDACGPPCGQCGGGCHGQCGYWAQAELLLWWRRGRNFPPLVTSSPAGTSAENAGVLGQPGTLVLFGDETTGDNARTGGRLTLGKWLDSCQIWGIEGRYFAVDDAPARFNLDSAGAPILARPFFNVATGQQDSRLIGFPNVTTGSVNLESTSEMTAAEFHLRRLIGRTACWRFDLLGGYFFSRIDEDLQITSSTVSTATGGSIPVGTTSELTDVFDTRNEFHGAQIGFMSEYQGSCWRLNVLGKMALGSMRQQVQIAGQSTVTVPGEIPISSSQGLLALNSNSGLYERDVFAVVPELGLNLAYSIHPNIDLTLGYSLVYWSRVAQPGDQINLLINPTQTAGNLVGAAQPDFIFQDNTYWVHGLSFGVECRF